MCVIYVLARSPSLLKRLFLFSPAGGGPRWRPQSRLFDLYFHLLLLMTNFSFLWFSSGPNPPPRPAGPRGIGIFSPSSFSPFITLETRPYFSFSFFPLLLPHLASCLESLPQSTHQRLFSRVSGFGGLIQNSLARYSPALPRVPHASRHSVSSRRSLSFAVYVSRSAAPSSFRIRALSILILPFGVPSPFYLCCPASDVCSLTAFQ